MPATIKTETFADKCARLEHWETDPWAAAAVLTKEILTGLVIDPNTGTGILGRAAENAGYDVLYADIEDWGHKPTYINDWLNPDAYIRHMVRGQTVYMNPPFSVSEKFVDMAFELGARKIICFQRFPWFEGSDIRGKKRGQWWKDRMPARIWVCGDRANCHLHCYPQEQRDTGNGTKHTHAFFVWEEGHAPAALTGHIFKSDITAAA